MRLLSKFRKSLAGLISAAVFLSPLASSIVFADDEDSYSVSVDPVTVIAGEETTFTAVFYKNGEEFDPSEEGLTISWWCVSQNSAGSNSSGTTNVFTYDEAGVYAEDLKVELWDSSTWIAGAYPTITVSEADPDNTDEEDITDPEVTPSAEDVLSVSLGSDEIHPGDTVDIEAEYVVDGQTLTELPEGYELWFWPDQWSEGHEDGNIDASALNNSGTTFTDSITFNSEGTYYIAAEVKDANNNRVLIAFVTAIVSEEEDEIQEDGLYVSLGSTDIRSGDTVSIEAEYVVDGQTLTELPEGYNLWFWPDQWAEGHEDGSVDMTVLNNSGTTFTDNITFNSAGTYYVAAQLKNGNSTVEQIYITVEVTDVLSSPVEGDINFDGVPTLPDDFFMGVDVSSVISELNSGVVYYDYSGNALTTVDQFVSFLASQGVNCIRVRVWNNPYDSNGNGFGGGNNDVSKAKILADACENAGITMLVDFHLSDFWCDPGKQPSPSAWSSLSVSERADAISAFITDSLNTIDPNRNTVSMVQVGNETNGGVCGVTNQSDMCTLFDAGCDAVHSWNSGTRAVIHFTNPERGTISSWASVLSNAGVSADVLATSYYPYWHGSLSNLTAQLQSAASYGYEVMVAETSYAYTLNDTDGHDNTVRTGNNDTGDNLLEAFSVQGQARSVRNVVNAVNNAGGIGVFYWEPAWITVGDTTGLTGDDYSQQVSENSALWEQYGSGWASSYAAVFDPVDAGLWYGGSAVDNEALFYPDGTPTAAWGVYENIRTGEYSTSITVESVQSFEVTAEAGAGFTLPGTATITYSNGSTAEADVEWNAEDIAAADADVPGTYVIGGTAAGMNTSFTLVVLPVNLIDSDVAGFETDSYASSYILEGNGGSTRSTDTARSGSYCFHWWADAASEATVRLSDPVSLSQAGTYTFTGYAQGDSDIGSEVTFSIIDASSGEVISSSDAMTTTGWKNWISPAASLTIDQATEVYLEITVNYQAGGWGTIDDLMLYLSEAEVCEPTPEETEPTPPSSEPVEEGVPESNSDNTATSVISPLVNENDSSETAVQQTVVSSDPSTGSVSSASSGSGVITRIVHDLSSLISALYTRLLGREPDEAGKLTWLNGIESNDLTYSGLVFGFVYSEEYLSYRKTDEEFVTDLYEVLLGRTPDQNGLDNWLSILESGGSRVQVIYGIVNSEEFKLRVEAWTASN